MVPKYVFLTKGVGKHKEKLESFELALRDARIEKFNLVRASSIFPPFCKIIPVEKGLQMLSPGEIVFCVLSENASNEPNRLLVASIGVAIPKDRSQYGYISEHHAFGQTERAAGIYAEDLAACMLASTLGIEFDEEVTYDTRREIWKMHKMVVKTRNITQSALVDKKGLWTTVVAAAVFVPGKQFPLF